MIVQPVLPAGMLIAVLVPVVAVPVSVTLPVYVAVGLLQAIVKLYVPGAPVAGAPVTVLVIVTATLFLVSGLVTPTLGVLPATNVTGNVPIVGAPQV